MRAYLGLVRGVHYALIYGPMDETYLHTYCTTLFDTEIELQRLWYLCSMLIKTDNYYVGQTMTSFSQH